MRYVGVWLACFAGLGCFVGCGRTVPPAAAETGQATASKPPAAKKSGQKALAAQAPKKPAKAAAAPKGQPPEPDHCPPEMVYVHGDYCTDSSNPAKPDEHGNTPGAGAKDIEAIERQCLNEWYAEQNKKRACEEFAPGGKGTGKMVPKSYCIDRYEWPNVKGQRPEVMNRFHQAQVKRCGCWQAPVHRERVDLCSVKARNEAISVRRQARRQPVPTQTKSGTAPT